jgi:hypothetical protein
MTQSAAAAKRESQARLGIPLATLTALWMAEAAAAAPGEPIPIPEQTPLYHALERSRYVRQAQIRAIEQRTGRRLIAYIAGAQTSISASDIPPFVDILDDIEPGSGLDLLLHTPGGDVDQAERLVLLCRKRVGTGLFRVIVPDSAKSAGTLIAIAADTIVMGEPSELGPIDPQVTIITASGEPMVRPAQSFLDGLQAIVNEAEEELSAAYFPLLDKLDPALIDFCRKALQRSEQFAEKFLTKHMLSEDPDKARAVAHALNNVEEHLSHGAVIDAERALEIGLKVELLPHDHDLWQAYWRLYCEMRMALTSNTARLYEGRKASLLYNGS